MPELPEVETVRRGLAPAMEGAVIAAVEARRATLRFALPDRFAARLTGGDTRALWAWRSSSTAPRATPAP